MFIVLYCHIKIMKILLLIYAYKSPLLIINLIYISINVLELVKMQPTCIELSGNGSNPTGFGEVVVRVQSGYPIVELFYRYISTW